LTLIALIYADRDINYGRKILLPFKSKFNHEGHEVHEV